MKKIFLISLCAVTLCGCVSTSTQMINDDGQVANCGGWGFGLVGAPAALITVQNCIDEKKAAGFHEIGTPSPQPSVTTTQQTTATLSPQNQAPPSIVTSKDGSFKLSLPEGWKQDTPPATINNPQIYARNRVIDAALVVTSVDKNDIQDWLIYVESLQKKLSSHLTQSTSSDIQKIRINGFDAMRSDVSGVANNGVKIHYLATDVKTDNNIIHIVSFCGESKFNTYRQQFEQLASGLQMTN